MEKMSPMRFIYMFIEYVDSWGIYDELDTDQNVMVTSKGVQNLINIARELLPERVANDEAAEMMRELTPAERDLFIQQDEENVIVDARDMFAEKVAENRGARGILAQLVDAKNEGDFDKIQELMSLAEELSEKV